MKPYRSGSWLGVLILALLAVFGANAQASDAGADAYQAGACAACHTIGGGRLVGPDLAGISSKRSQEWLVSFIRSSQTLIKSGDADAVAVFEEYSSMLMPDAPISNDQILAVLDYIGAQSAGAAPGTPTSAPSPGTVSAVPAAAIEPVPVAAPSAEQITLGQELFQGNVRFENGGPTCNACHDIADDAIIGGGILARELTDVFSRMGGPGVQAILGRPPFPVMEIAYAEQPLTDGEITALVAVLQSTAERQAKRLPRDYGMGLFTSGVAGSVLVFGSCSLIWRRRKKESVNQSIYDRQVKSK